jgi:hypothetical protein
LPDWWPLEVSIVTELGVDAVVCGGFDTAALVDTLPP